MPKELTPLPYGVENGRRVLYITYKGDCRMVRVEGRDLLFTTHTLSDALSCVRPGDILQLLPGKYWPPILFDEDSGNPPVCRPVKINELQGKPDVPITIRGLGAATVLNGGLGGVPHDSLLPEMKHFAFFKLADCAWIEFENFHVESCWPTFLYLENSSYITVRNVTAMDSRYLIYARGQSTHHILIEGNYWRQDPTGAMWRDQLWLDSKRKRYFYCNGGLFGSVGIAGSVVLRHNTICDVFNAMRMKAAQGQEDTQNFNVEIYGNHMVRTRDNPVEPERAATNWWVHHNRIHNAHAWFSLDEVRGGFWYFFANQGYITDKPGNELDPNRGGKVYKYDTDGSMPEHPVFAFNNSYFLCNSLIKGGATTYLTHRNNAVLFRNSLDDPVPQDELARCPLPDAVRHPFPDGCQGADRFLGDGFMPAGWNANVSFDCDLTNLAWPGKITDNKQEANGIFDAEARFQDPDAGDLRLVGGARPGCQVMFAPGSDWAGGTPWLSGPDTPIGAYDREGKLVEGPPFVFMPIPGEDQGRGEMPRLVRMKVEDGELVLTFSVSLGVPGLVRVRLKAGSDKQWLDALAEGRVLRAKLPKPLAGRRIRKVWLPDELMGADGQYVTLWSSVFAGLRFYRTGETSRVAPPKPVCFCNCGAED